MSYQAAQITAHKKQEAELERLHTQLLFKQDVVQTPTTTTSQQPAARPSSEFPCWDAPRLTHCC